MSLPSCKSRKPAHEVPFPMVGANCNPDPNVQRGVGYSQYDFFNKMIFKINSNLRITSNIQYSTSSNIPRFDKLNDGDLGCVFDTTNTCLSADGLKFHSYHYGPQKRLFSSLKLSSFNSKYFDKGDFILSYQKIGESRHKWYLDDFLDYLGGIENYDPETNQYEDLNVYSLNINLRKGSVSFGSETVYNNVFSSTTPNGENTWGIGDTRYPPNGSSIFSSACYINLFKRISHKLQLDVGGRYTFSNIRGEFPDSMHRPLADIEGLRLSSNNSIVSGNIKFVYYPFDDLKISAVTSRGFHTPNVDDMLKVFRKGDNITIPNIHLKPEYSLSQELSITKNISKKLTCYGVGFYTQLSDAIIKDSIPVNINPSIDGEPLLVNMILYDDELVYTFANQNSTEKVSIFGLTLGFTAEVLGFQINGDFNLTKGVGEQSKIGPIPHIPPNFGKIELLRNLAPWTFRGLCIYAGSKSEDEFDQAGIDNLNETPYVGLEESLWAGSPGWWVLNFSTEYAVNDHLRLQFGVENLLDAHYKSFGSGISSPGRNFVFSVRSSF